MESVMEYDYYTRIVMEYDYYTVMEYDYYTNIFVKALHRARWLQ
jgi:hypothetical protein